LYPEPTLARASLAEMAYEYHRASLAGGPSAHGVGICARSQGALARVWIPVAPVAAVSQLRDYLAARLFNIFTVVSPESLEVHCSAGLCAAVGQAISLLRSSPGSYSDVLSLVARMHGRQPDIMVAPSAPTARFEQWAAASAPAAGLGTGPIYGPLQLFDRIQTLVVGIDVGGTDVKVAVAGRSGVDVLLEHVWSPQPKAFTNGRQFAAAICVLIRFAVALFHAVHRTCPADLHETLGRLANDPHASLQDIAQAAERAAAAGLALPGPEAVGLSFPDVVSRHKIVGGMTSKYAGIRAKYQDPVGVWRDEPGYWTEFDRDIKLLPKIIAEDTAGWAGSAPWVSVMNDGTAGSLWAAVETNRPNVLSLSLGTSVAGGKTDGQCQPDPGMFEVANAVTLIGADPKGHLRHRTLGLSGCLQQVLSQDAVFRLAVAAGVLSGFPAGCEAETLAWIANDLSIMNTRAVETIYQGMAAYLCHGLLTLQQAAISGPVESVALFGRVVRGGFGREIISRYKALINSRPEFAALRHVELLRASDIPCRTPVRAKGNLDALAQAIGAVFLAAQQLPPRS